MFKTLRSKLLCAFLVIILLCVGSISVLSGNFLTDALHNQLGKEAVNISNVVEISHKNATLTERTIEEMLGNEMLGQAELVAELLKSGNVTNTYLAQLSEETGIDEFYVTDGDGVTVLSNNKSAIGWRFPEKGQAAEFRQLLDDPSKKIVQQAQKRDIDDKVFKFVGIAREDEPGIVQVGIEVNTLEELKQQIGHEALLTKLTDKKAIEYAAVISKDGKLLSESGEVQEGIENSQLVTKALKNNKRYTDIVTINGKKTYQMVYPDNNDNYFVLGVDYEKTEKAAQASRNTLFILGFAAILLCVMVVFFVANRLTRPITKLSEASEAIAAGDLSQNVNIESDDEIGRLSSSFNKMVSNLRAVVAGINSQSEIVATNTEQMTSAAQQTASTTNETASNMSELSATVENISSNVQEVANVAERTNSTANEGKNTVDKAIMQMDSISASTKEMAGVVKELNDKSESINQIIELITNVNEQTNLLALNAAIEAARAGEAGKGFAVVAEEVRTLAEQSAKASDDIKHLIDEIRQRTNNTVEHMEENEKLINEGNETVISAGNAFADITEGVQNLSQRLDDISSSGEEMSSSIQNVAAASEEQNAMVEEITNSTETLSKVAADLRNEVSKFNISDD